MSSLDKWIDNKFLQNLIIWVMLYLLFLLIIQSENVFLDCFLILMFIMPFVYINNLFILPLFYGRETTFGVLAIGLNLALYTAAAVFLLNRIVSDFEWRMVYNMLGSGILIISFASAFKIARDSFERRQKAKDAELRLLKGQLNPHFLFNTLNNLYGLSVVKSEKLPGLMLQLSDLLRYSLYETKAEFVPLEKEIQYLESYISLEKIRLEEKAVIKFETDINSAISIPPMLLIVFVENAFKHLGMLKNGEQEVFVSLKTHGNSLGFICTNSTGEINELEQNETSGIGLNNVKKRLELLYPNKHNLQIMSHDNQYTIKLNLTNQ